MIFKINKSTLMYCLADTILIISLVFSNYFFMYLMPRKEKCEDSQKIDNPLLSSENQDNQFSDNIINNDTTYKSKNISITISKKIFIPSDNSSSVIKDSAPSSISPIINDNGLPLDNNSKDLSKNNINYYVADIYLADINCLKTHFAKETCGSGYLESLLDIEKNNDAILGINGDSYSMNKSNDLRGPLIRNGTIYRKEDTNNDVCLMYKDGTILTFTNSEYKNANINFDEVYNSWVFGPALQDKNGKHITSFDSTSSYIKKRHPRTAIGYFAPGHYCFVVADGRGLNQNNGMLLEELSQIFESLGCKASYNLDGGHCSFLSYNGQYINSPSSKNSKVPDGIFIEEEN